MKKDERIEEYVRVYGIDKHFSRWEEYRPELVLYKKGTMICMPGEAVESLLFIVDGKVAINMISPDGRFAAIGITQPPLMLGDMEFAGKFGVGEAKAITDVWCVAIPFSKYIETLREDVKFLQYVCKTLSDKVNKSAWDKYGERFMSLKQRFASRVLALERDEKLKCNWREVSESLGVSYRQIMRILAELCKNGVLCKGEKLGEYVIIDKTELEKLYRGL